MPQARHRQGPGLPVEDLIAELGGEAGYGKIAAARTLGLPVVMIARPPAEPPREREAVAR